MSFESTIGEFGWFKSLKKKIFCGGIGSTFASGGTSSTHICSKTSGTSSTFTYFVKGIEKKAFVLFKAKFYITAFIFSLKYAHSSFEMLIWLRNEAF